VTPEDQPVPPKLPAGVAIQFVINGNGTSIHYSPQNAATGPVAAVGAPGSRSVQAGGDATAARADDQSPKDGWWARLRKRGIVVAIATIVGAIAAVIATAVAICAWAGWTP